MGTKTDSSLVIVSREARAIEQLLRETGAHGRSLGSLVADMKSQLPRTLTRQLFIIVNIRNSVIHDGEELHNPKRFKDSCADAKHDLKLFAKLLFQRATQK